MGAVDLSSFRPATDGASVTFVDEAVQVVGLPEAWAYSARADLYPSSISGSVRVDLKVTVHEGKLLAGVLTTDETSFIREATVRAGQRTAVSLRIRSIHEASAVVFRTAKDSPGAPRFTIHEVSVSPDDEEPEPTLGVHELVESLWPLSVAEYSTDMLHSWDETTLNANLTGDKLMDNLLLNKWEFTHGRSVLRSYPWRLSVPFVLCNSRCEFCAAWLMKGKAPLLDFMQALVPVIERCCELDLVGWGEPLIHPEFDQILALIKQHADPRARVALTTNGVRLKEWVDRLLDANVMDYAISVHARTARPIRTSWDFTRTTSRR
jgi:hypothetical protein